MRYKGTAMFPIYRDPQRVGTPLTWLMSKKRWTSFQFIGIPSEWGLVDELFERHIGSLSFQFIGIPSEWGLGEAIRQDVLSQGFQFIGIPSEWGLRAAFKKGEGDEYRCFQFIGIPSEWGRISLAATASSEREGFQFIGIPSEWGPFVKLQRTRVSA